MSRRDSNTGGSDLWFNTLPLDHGGARYKLSDIMSYFTVVNIGQYAETQDKGRGREATESSTNPCKIQLKCYELTRYR
jgi:hypothetical protein